MINLTIFPKGIIIFKSILFPIEIAGYIGKKNHGILIAIYNHHR